MPFGADLRNEQSQGRLLIDLDSSPFSRKLDYATSSLISGYCRYLKSLALAEVTR